MQPFLLGADLHIGYVVIVTKIQTEIEKKSQEVGCGLSWPGGTNYGKEEGTGCLYMHWIS